MFLMAPLCQLFDFTRRKLTVLPLELSYNFVC